MAPGILYVTMQHKQTIDPAQFHDWYNNEHGPLRLRLNFCQNGFRYKAADLEGPGKGQDPWMAIYDLDDVEDLNGQEYMKLRGPPCQTDRERSLRPHLDINRRTYDFISEKSVSGYKKIESNVGSEKQGNVMVAVALTVKEGKDGKEVERWYDEEHIDMLSKVPGWKRTRRFKTSTIDLKEGRAMEYLALHEYAPENGLGGPEFKAATSTPWNNELMENVVAEKRRRVWDLYYTFGPAPRHLDKPADWDAPAIGTRTYPSNTVESYITTPDGAELKYRLEGSSDDNSPVILCCNSILVTYGIWDAFVTSFLQKNPSYRILRYNTRGRTSSVGTNPITVDSLADDAITLLSALRISSVALAIGVSLGGATVLNLGLRHPARIPRFLSCDTNSKSPAGNSKAWTERIELAARDNATSTTTKEAVVGPSLAEITTRRWFVKETYDGAAMEKEAQRVTEMVHDNSLEGFKASVKALWEYDMDPLMGKCESKGFFLVGSGDGVLPAGMKKMAEALGKKGTTCTVIEGAGHLPMVEKPEDVVKAVEEVLKS